MSPSLLAIEAEAAHLLVGFFNDFDERRYARMTPCFAADGEWHRRGKVWVGPDGVMQALRERTETLRTRHVITNLHVTPDGAGGADFVLYLTAYMHDDGKGAPPPVRIAGPAMLIVVEGRLRETAEGWRIARMAMNREFEFA